MKRVELRELRVMKGLTQTELGKLAQLSQNDISLIERGLRNPSARTAKRIARVLDFDWTDFYKEESDEQLQAKENVE